MLRGRHRWGIGRNVRVYKSSLCRQLLAAVLLHTPAEGRLARAPSLAGLLPMGACGRRRAVSAAAGRLQPKQVALPDLDLCLGPNVNLAAVCVGRGRESRVPLAARQGRQGTDGRGRERTAAAAEDQPA